MIHQNHEAPHYVIFSNTLVRALNIFLGTHFTKTLSLCSYLQFGD
jgi:hypothetical protein